MFFPERTFDPPKSQPLGGGSHGQHTAAENRHTRRVVNQCFRPLHVYPPVFFQLSVLAALFNTPALSLPRSPHISIISGSLILWAV